MATALRIRTDTGEESLDLEEFEQRVARGEIAPHCPVLFQAVAGDRWVQAGDLELFRALFSPEKHAFARRFSLSAFPRLTLLLIAANLAVFLLMKQEGPIDTNAMVRWGAKVAPLIGDLGQFWRLLTANFIHRDWVHIGFNAFVLFNVGGALENAYRPIDYLSLLFASALGCTLASLAFSPDSISVGASGIAYGAMGGAVVFGLRFRDILPSRYRRILGEAAIPTILVFLYIGWSSTGVDNWGHLGGLTFGAAAASWMPPRLLLARKTGPASSVIRALPMGVVTVFLCLGGRVFAPALPVLLPIHDEASGLEVRIPSTWQRGADRFGQLAFYNGLPDLGRAAFAATPEIVPAGRLLQEDIQDFIHVQLSSDQLEDVVIGRPEPALVDGRDALLVRASFQTHDDVGPTRVKAYFVPRGNLVYQLVFALSEAYPDYERVAQEMVEAVRFTEPTGLEQARARFLLQPNSAVASARLGESLLQLGEPADAARLLSHACSLRPADASMRSHLAEALLEEGAVGPGCGAALEASAEAPGNPDALLARLDCELAHKDRAGAAADLERLRGLQPADPALEVRRRRLSELP